jgi:predicted Zn-dependent peptidase
MIQLINDFKTIQIAYFFVDIDQKAYAVHRYLLPRLMTSSTDHITSRQQMSKQMEELYGAYIKARTERMGNLSVMSFVLTFVDPKIVKDPDLFDQAMALFDQVIFSHERFNQDVFDDEKRMLIEQWETLKDKKRSYARERFTSLFFEGDNYGYPLSGTLKDIKKIKIEQMETYYQHMFSKQRVYVVTNGHTEGLDLAPIGHKFGDQTLEYPLITSFRAPREVKMVTEETDMQQAIVKMGYILPIYRHDALYDASVILDIILGGYPESRLFKVIREEEGLCYDISSSYDYYKGVVMISSGIDLSKVDHALKSIQDLVENIKTSGITGEELLHAKAYYIHQIKSSLDSQSTLTKRAFVREMLHYQETIEEKIQKIENVRLEDVEKAASMLVLDTIYVLKGGAA